MRRLSYLAAVSYFLLQLNSARGFAEDLQGTITDSSGSPIEGAVIQLRKTGDRQILADVATQENGGFTTGPIHSGPYQLTVTNRSFVTKVVFLRIMSTTGLQPIQVKLARLGLLSGLVTSLTVRPLVVAA